MKMITLIAATMIAFTASTTLASSDCASRAQAGRFANTNPKAQVKYTQVAKTKSATKTVKGTR